MKREVSAAPYKEHSSLKRFAKLRNSVNFAVAYSRATAILVNNVGVFVGPMI